MIGHSSYDVIEAVSAVWLAIVGTIHSDTTNHGRLLWRHEAQVCNKMLYKMIYFLSIKIFFRFKHELNHSYIYFLWYRLMMSLSISITLIEIDLIDNEGYIGKGRKEEDIE